MGSLNFTYRQRARAIRKIEGTEERGLVIGGGPERTSWYYIDGTKTFKVIVGQVHSGDMKPGTAKALLSDLRLNASSFNDLANCPMTAVDYHQHILQMKLQGLL